MFQNVWRVCLEHNSRCSHLKHHSTSSIISIFQYAYCWAPPYKEKIKKLHILLIFGKVGQFHEIHKCHTKQTERMYSHKVQQAEVEDAQKQRKKTNS